MSAAAQTAAHSATPSAIFHPGFGDKLRQAREALELTPADVAAKLKLGARQIEALEAEDYSQLPGEVFIRGFVRNYARLVELDPETLIIPMDIHAVVYETVTAPSEGVIFASPGLRRWVLLPMLAMAFFVLLVAVLYYWLRQGEDALVSETAPPVATAPVAPAPPPVSVMPPVAPASTETVAPADLAPGMPGTAPQTLAVPGVAPAPAVAAPAPAPATPVKAIPDAPAATAGKPASLPIPAAVVKPAPVPAKPLLPPAQLAPAAVPAAAAPALKGHTLRFVPALDAWIQVVDGKGKRYSKLVRSGDAEIFAGEPPFKLVVGEAAQVQLSYDGHPIDLTPYIGQKVARLTLE
jgi:cytoskeleton protein RodZ